MKAIGIIPARYQSSRLPGKPLADIHGIPMILHVYRRASEALPCVVATDDERIYQAVVSAGGKAIMTRSDHSTGSNRCLEAYEKLGESADVILNIQGDEPLLEVAQLLELLDCFQKHQAPVATLVRPVSAGTELPEGVFVVGNALGEALYFSRAPIPHQRDRPKAEWSQHHRYLTHIGLYAYSPEALREFCALEQSPLEQMEMLEQNRWLEAGGRISFAESQYPTQAVDTPADLERVRALMQKEGA